MNFRNWGTALLLMLAMSISVFGQTISHLGDTRRPVGAPVDAFPTTDPSRQGIESQPMPADRIDQPTSLDTELEAIRAHIPEFNSVVIRDPAVVPDYPTLPMMTLKNVTVGQFLQFVQAAYPAVQVIRIDGLAGPLYSIRVRAQGDSTLRPATPQNHVRLYRLNEMIYFLADESAAEDKDNKDEKAPSRADRIKDATNQVLSLLQAALDQTDNDGPSTLKIHEPTLTLMFKGSEAKQQVLEEALNTLQPRGVGPRGNKFFSQSSGSSSWTSPNTSSTPEPFGQAEVQYRLYQQALTEKNEALQEQSDRLQAELKAMRAQAEQAAAQAKQQTQQPQRNKD